MQWTVLFPLSPYTYLYSTHTYIQKWIDKLIKVNLINFFWQKFNVFPVFHSTHFISLWRVTIAWTFFTLQYLPISLLVTLRRSHTLLLQFWFCHRRSCGTFFLKIVSNWAKLFCRYGIWGPFVKNYFNWNLWKGMLAFTMWEGQSNGSQQRYYSTMKNVLERWPKLITLPLHILNMGQKGHSMHSRYISIKSLWIINPKYTQKRVTKCNKSICKWHLYTLNPTSHN